MSASRKAARSSSGSAGAAPFGRRIIAFLIDWYVGSLATALPVACVAMSLGLEMTEQNVLSYPEPMGLAAALLGIAAGVAYYALVPMVFRGQTLGKRLLGLRIIDRDGAPAAPVQLILRQFVGLILIEQAAVGTGAVVQQLVALVAGGDVATIVMWAGFALTLVSLVVCGVRPDRRALHDLIAGTRVTAV